MFAVEEFRAHCTTDTHTFPNLRYRSGFTPECFRDPLDILWQPRQYRSSGKFSPGK